MYNILFQGSQTPHYMLAFQCRNPETIFRMLQKDEVLFTKSSRVEQAQEWLGGGLFSQLDNQKHAAMRQTLNPAFRKEYLQQLDSFFVSSAMKVANVLAGAAGAGEAVDLNQLFKRMTLDSIGLTNLQYDFHSLDLWEAKQQQQQGKGEEHQLQQGVGSMGTVLPQPPPAGAGAGVGEGKTVMDVEQLLTDLSAAFLWQSLMLPVPRKCLFGIGSMWFVRKFS